MDRRKFIKNGTILTAGLSVSPVNGGTGGSGKKKSFKAAFLTDVHIKPEEVAEKGMRQAFRHVNALQPAPDFIMNGGDSIMDALAADQNETRAQWDLWEKVLLEENKLPVYHCIGNHDIWGWQVDDERIRSNPLYGKSWAVQQFKLQNRFYSFEREKWKFIVLDSTQQDGAGYIARFDEEQLAWLEMELMQSPKEKHICIVSHIPIVSFCSALFFDEMQADGNWKLLKVLLHADARRVIRLFRNFPNVKVCLSGHIHLQDEVEYMGVRYFCNGAVSGNWWKGPFKDFEPAYALFDFYEDGSVERKMMVY